MRMYRVMLWISLLTTRIDTATVSSKFQLSKACLAPYDGVLLVLTKVSHLHRCAVYCTDNYRCSSFVYDATTLVCRTSSLAVPPDVSTACEDLVTYGSASQINWRQVGMGTCQTDEGCSTHVNTECVEGQCRCLNGYSYSSMNNVCQDDCEAYGDTFQLYPSKKIKGGTLATYENATTLQSCLSFCIKTDTFVCKSAEYFPSRTICKLSDDTVLTKGNRYETYDTNTFLHRNCV